MKHHLITPIGWFITCLCNVLTLAAGGGNFPTGQGADTLRAADADLYYVGFFPTKGNDIPSSRTIGLDGEGSFAMAIELKPDWLVSFEGSQLVGIRLVGMPATNPSITAFVKADLYKQEILTEVKASLPAVDKKPSWIEAHFPTPITIKRGDHLFLGYTGTNTDDDGYLIQVSDQVPPVYGTCWISRPIEGWREMSSPDKDGSPRSSVLIQGIFKMKEGVASQPAVLLSASLDSAVLRSPKRKISLSARILNIGNEPIKSASFSVKVGNKQAISYAPTLSEPINNLREMLFSIPMEGLEAGSNQISLALKKLNGKDLDREVQIIPRKISVCEATGGLFDKHLLLDVFTAEWCTYCPQGKALIAKVVDSFVPEVKSRIFSEVLHEEDGVSNKFGTQNYVNIVTRQVKVGGYPDLIIDRVPNDVTGAYSASAGTFVEKTINPKTEAIVRAAILKAFGDGKAVASVALSLERGDMCSAKISGQVNKALIGGADLRLTAVLIKNNLKTIGGQKGVEHPLEYIHQHVMVMPLTDLRGDKIEIRSDGSYSLKKIFAPNTDLKDTYVLAFLHETADIGGRVLNTMQANLESAPISVQRIEQCEKVPKTYVEGDKIVVDGGCDDINVYSIDGSLSPNSNLNPGVYVARILKGGALYFVKVLVK